MLPNFARMLITHMAIVANTVRTHLENAVVDVSNVVMKFISQKNIADSGEKTIIVRSLCITMRVGIAGNIVQRLSTLCPQLTTCLICGV